MPKSARNQSSNPTRTGFQISDLPVITNDCPESETAEQLPATYGTDSLYLIARDPTSLFVYWDLDWRRLFEDAGISSQAIHLRIYREDGTLENTQPINPFRGHCYAEVSGAGTSYYCELGCFEGETWRSLVRSAAAATPESEMSDDLSASFATLPIHLSFQRLLDIFQATKRKNQGLAVAVAELQAKARNGERPKMDSADLAAVLESALDTPDGSWTEAQRAVWQELTEQLGNPGWSGASERNFGGSSLA